MPFVLPFLKDKEVKKILRLNYLFNYSFIKYFMRNKVARIYYSERMSNSITKLTLHNTSIFKKPMLNYYKEPLHIIPKNLTYLKITKANHIEYFNLFENILVTPDKIMKFLNKNITDLQYKALDIHELNEYIKQLNLVRANVTDLDMIKNLSLLKCLRFNYLGNRHFSNIIVLNGLQELEIRSIINVKQTTDLIKGLNNLIKLSLTIDNANWSIFEGSFIFLQEIELKGKIMGHISCLKNTWVNLHKLICKGVLISDNKVDTILWPNLKVLCLKNTRIRYYEEDPFKNCFPKLKYLRLNREVKHKILNTWNNLKALCIYDPKSYIQHCREIKPRVKYCLHKMILKWKTIILMDYLLPNAEFMSFSDCDDRNKFRIIKNRFKISFTI